MPRSPDRDRSIVRRDAEGNAQAAGSWESLTERLIRRAQEAGAFEGLPGHGRPLRADDDAFAGDMATANRLLRNAGAAPPWIEADKAARAHLGTIERVLDRAALAPPGAADRYARQLEDAMDAYDEAAARLEPLAPTVRQQRRPLDRVALRRRLADAARQRPSPG